MDSLVGAPDPTGGVEPPATAFAPQGDAITRLAESLVQEARQELAQAEAKAVWLLSAAVIALGAVLSGAESGSWSPDRLSSGLARVVLWASLAASGAGVYWLAMSLLPRFRNDGNRDKLAYFGHAAQFGFDTSDRSVIRANLGAALVHAATQTDNLDRLSDRVFDISTIVLSKYRRIRRAIQSFGVSALLFGVAMGIEALLR
ncbi:MAG TPA: Pycsar system effector family protein [Acidimicrobiales bacterium]|nr:Pycsar system effector family protein [Acidimicrobiales bacterium]